MKIMNIYKKSLTFFLRSRQEKIVANIEREFYIAITGDAQDPQELCRLHLKLEKICKEIRLATMQYYFEDDLLDHLFSLLTFVENYIEEFKTERCPEKHFRVKHTRFQATK